MGGHAWFYTVDYEPDVTGALQKLRKREFAAGRYNPVTPFPEFPLGAHSPAPGARHASIAKALEAAAADGTRSILDIEALSEEPDFNAVARLSNAVLLDLYGTVKPTREMVEENMDFLEDIERGQGVYLFLYDEDERPVEIFFAGYSFD